MMMTSSRRPAFSIASMLTLNIGIVVVRKAEKPTTSGSCSWIASTNVSGRDLHAEIDDLEAGALEHDVDEVLADVVHVALDRAHQEGADRSRLRSARAGGAGVERARHGPAGDQHLGHEEVAALEAGPDLLERRDQRLEQHRRRLEALLEPLLGELDDGRLVADERLVVEALQDLLVGHAPRSPGSGQLDDARTARRPRATTSADELGQALARRAHRGRRDGDRGDHRSPRAAHRGGGRAQAGLELLPRRRVAERAGPPRARRSRSAIVVIVPGPSLASRPNGGWAAPKAMKTLPIDDAWIGMRLPTQLPAPSGCVLSSWASRATPPGVGMAMFVVSPVARPSSSRNGKARRRQVADARVAGARSRRAPAPDGSRRPRRRWARPLRSSARSRRAAVDFGSCVSSMTPVERHGLVALDEAREDPRRPVDRLCAFDHLRHGCRIMALDEGCVKPRMRSAAIRSALSTEAWHQDPFGRTAPGTGTLRLRPRAKENDREDRRAHAYRLRARNTRPRSRSTAGSGSR